MSFDMPVFKIAKPGGTVEDPEKDLAFTSDRTCINELFSGYVDVNTDGSGNGTADFTHDLGYRPSYYCFVRDPLNTGNWYPHQDGYMGLSTNVGTTKLYFDILGKEASSTYRVFYQIFGNQQENGTGTGKNNVTGKIKIAKPGYKADTETDARNMQFFSGGNVYKVDTALSGSESVTVDDYIVETVIPHNLDYVPVAFVLNDSTYGSPLGQMLPSTVFEPSFSYYINDTNLVIISSDAISGGSPSFNATFKYKILRDKIA